MLCAVLFLIDIDVRLFISQLGNQNFVASGRGARESACACLINQLQRCRFDPRIACLENTDSNCRRLVDGGGGTQRPELLTGAIKEVPTGVPD